METTPESPTTIVPQLQTVLRALSTSQYPDLPTPPETNKRASVALIIRIKPFYAHWPAPKAPHRESLDSFFSQEWAQHGDPEVLFIKRASRKGDRWTAHVALPGGRRDPEDKDDQAAAIRETWEEVGLDLNTYGIPCGNLPQRVVTTHWGKKPLLVLCPYIFLLTTHEIPPLKLQPTEVAATHWVPLRSLLDVEQRTVVFEDVASRIVNQETGVRLSLARMILGQMVFAAINLVPTESLHSVESPSEEITRQDNRFVRRTARAQLHHFIHRLRTHDLFNQFAQPKPEAPLLLWGLTLGAVSDFFQFFPPHDALTLWTYPTFTPPDVRFAIWLLTYRFKNRKRAELQSGTDFQNARPAFGTATESVAPSTFLEEISASTVMVERRDETGLHGLGSGVGLGLLKGQRPAVQTMLEGWVDGFARAVLPSIANRDRYYDIVRRAVFLAMAGRAGVLAVLVVLAWKRWGKR